MLPENDRIVYSLKTNFSKEKYMLPEDDRIVYSLKTITLARNNVCSLRMIV